MHLLLDIYVPPKTNSSPLKKKTPWSSEMFPIGNPPFLGAIPLGLRQHPQPDRHPRSGRSWQETFPPTQKSFSLLILLEDVG